MIEYLKNIAMLFSFLVCFPYHWIMDKYYEWRFYQDVKLYREYFGKDSIQVARRTDKELVEDLKKECLEIQQGKKKL